MFGLTFFPSLLIVLALPPSSELPKKSQPSEVEQLIRQLGSESFDEREAASRRLEAMGEPALEALRKAASSNGDIEARRRVQDLVRAIERRLFGELRCFCGHEERVTCVTFSPNGRQLLSAGDDSTIRLWDTASGKELRCLRHYQVHSVAYSPDGRHALSGGGGRYNLLLWDLSSDKSGIWLWDLSSDKWLRSFEGHKDRIHSVVFSPDGKLALSGSADHTMRLWEVATGKELRRFDVDAGQVWAVTFRPGGKQVLSGHADGTARLWDVESGKEVKRIQGHRRSVVSVAFSPDGRIVATCDTHPTLRLWDVETKKEIRRFNGASGLGPNGVVFSPDGRRLLSCWSNRVLVLDAETGKEVGCFTEHGEEVQSVAVSPDGRLALSGGDDRTVRLWKLPK